MTQSLHAIVWYLFIIWLPNLMRAMHVYLTSINRKPSWSNPSRCWAKGIDCVGPPNCVYKIVYIPRGAHRYACCHKKPHKGDVVDQKTPYTLHAALKYVWVRWCVMCLNPECKTSMGHELYYNPNTVANPKPG